MRPKNADIRANNFGREFREVLLGSTEKLPKLEAKSAAGNSVPKALSPAKPQKKTRWHAYGTDGGPFSPPWALAPHLPSPEDTTWYWARATVAEGLFMEFRPDRCSHVRYSNELPAPKCDGCNILGLVARRYSQRIICAAVRQS